MNQSFGNVHGNVNTGTVHGDLNTTNISSTAGPEVVRLRRLVEELRAEIAKQQPANAAAIEAELGELTEATAKVKDATEVRGVRERFKLLLSMAGQISETAAKIVTAIHQVSA